MHARIALGAQFLLGLLEHHPRKPELREEAAEALADSLRVAGYPALSKEEVADLLDVNHPQTAQGPSMEGPAGDGAELRQALGA
jgi:hypothetical protein